jgi:pantoate--beta-alanine ligase
MEVWTTIPEWLKRRSEIAGSVGFVPTMGALHAGHASLVERCSRENEVVVVSIFVNPVQFNDRNDFERYPRTLDSDLSLLRSLGAHHVLAPPTPELYPDGYCFRVEGQSLTKMMEGAHRAGHLSGVLTIVLKLLNIVRAGRAYFGEKDYEQCKVVTDMAKDFFLSTEIVPCPTVREKSGLAKSSRNMLLSPGARDKAASLFRVLTTATGRDQAEALLEAEGFIVDYVEEHWGRRFAAVFLEGVRLIDNVPIPEGKSPGEPGTAGY